MDSLTHIALGACMGEAFAGRTVGKKAMIWGALAQSIPDIDFVSSFWMDVSSSLLAHRGFTHSFLFCLLITPLMATLAERWHRPHNISLRRWMAFFGAVIFTHIFIDAFNNYGVGWFEPFSQTRISFNAIYVADPFFSVWPAVALLALISFRRYVPRRRRWWQMGLGLASVYLIYCLVNKYTINRDVKEILKKQQVHYTQYFSTPAPLQNWLWFVVAGSDTGYHVGFRSLFDSKKEIAFQYFPKNEHLLDSLKDYADLHKLIRFSQDFYTVEKWHDTLVFNDLRFGQIVGWQDPREKFVFHYYLHEDFDNRYVVQRGRFAKWNWKVAGNMIRRIGGN
jgi:inner membrane protein